MIDSLRAHHEEIVGVIFAVVIIAAAWLEVFWPRRISDISRKPRWIANLALGAGNFALFALLPLGLYAAALMVEEQGWGLLHLLSMPWWLAIALGVLALDFAGYVMHRLMHGMPAFWALHHVHHSDLDMDFTTTVRHHPLEAVVSALIIIGAVLAFGISPESVVIHQFAGITLDFIAHSNLRLPAKLDGLLRLIFVTPDMHLVHHSSLQCETDSNYSTVLSVWDRLFGTYVAAPAGGVTGMTIGLDYRRESLDQRLDRVLLSPFMRRPAANQA